MRPSVKHSEPPPQVVACPDRAKRQDAPPCAIISLFKVGSESLNVCPPAI
jgi:hypothetical protein